MGGLHWIAQAFRRSFDYSGRSRRMEYWSYALFTFLLLSLIGFVEDQLGLPFDDRNDPVRACSFLALAIPGLAVAVRRLHDTNRSGWWLVLPIAPFLFWAVALVGHFNFLPLFRIVMVAFILAPLALLVLMCLPGTPGENCYGHDPKGQDLADRFR
jgi:uncharacterized membrane protein YhaH (DUF805 family)